MTDVVSAALRAAPAGEAFAYPLAFAAGVVTSVGPCVAPRYVALAALVQSTARPWRVAGAYLVGLVAAMVAIGLAVDALNALRAASMVLNLALATTLAVVGVVTLARGGRTVHGHAGECAPLGVGGIALLGASGALIVSPCCTPILAAIAGLTVTAGRFGSGTALLAVYALGHAWPLLLTTAAGTPLAAGFARLAGSDAPATVSGTLMLALASYYGLLA
ncbi:MAG: cytochrome c biogenesis protein CcdA [Vulcanimicrobiaceae bacterium]